jgi:hypothetical protein
MSRRRVSETVLWAEDVSVSEGRGCRGKSCLQMVALGLHCHLRLVFTFAKTKLMSTCIRHYKHMGSSSLATLLSVCVFQVFEERVCASFTRWTVDAIECLYHCKSPSIHSPNSTITVPFFSPAPAIVSLLEAIKFWPIDTSSNDAPSFPSSGSAFKYS